MKKNFIDKLLIVVLLFFALAACKGKESTATHDHAHTGNYTCPMHPQIVKDGPGTCPICGMDLVPQTTGNSLPIDSSLLPLLKSPNAQMAASLTAIAPESNIRIFSIPVQGVVSYDQRRQTRIASRVAGRIERLSVKYNYQPVRKGQLIMEIYSPELAAAQRELIYISRNDNNPALLQRAKQRLLLLGMQPAQIEKALRTGKPLYSVPVYSTVNGFIIDETSLTAAPLTTTPMASTNPSSAGSGGMDGMGASAPAAPLNTQPQVNNFPVMVREGQYVSTGQTVFTVYESSSLVADFYFPPSLASHIKRGQKMTYSAVASPEEIFTGSIGLVEPTQRKGATFTTARVYISSNALQPGQLLSGRIPVVARGWWLPETAVIGLGNRMVVFKKEEDVFVPKEVPVGIRAEGMVQVLDSVAGWLVAKNASYIVDNESFIQTSNNR
jgi:membrane fusion protein, copper/silver efflux system